MFAGGLLSAWPSRVGPTPLIAAGAEPLEGARVRHGHQGVIWPPSQAVLEYAVALKAGTFDRCYVEIVKHPDDAWYPTGIYQYDLHFDNNVLSSNYMVYEAIGASAGDSLPFSVALFLGGIWHNIRKPSHRPQVLSWTWLVDTLYVHRNGVLLGSFADVAKTFTTVGGREGNNRIATQHACSRGARYSARYAFGAVPTEDQIVALHGERMARFEISATEWDPLSLTTALYLCSAGKFGTPAGTNTAWEGGSNRIRLWYNLASSVSGVFEQHTDFVIGADNGNQAPDEGVRINGLPTLKTGVNKFGTLNQNLSAYITTTEFDVKAVVRVDSITSTQASNPYERDALFAETTGGVFAVSAALMSGVPSIGCCFFDGVGSGLARWKYPNVPITIGQPGLLHVTLTGGTLSVRWNDGTPATASVAALSDALARSGTLARGWGASPPFKGDVATMICRKVVPSAGNQTIERVWLGDDYGVAV